MKALLVGDLHIENKKCSIGNSESFREIFETFNLIKKNVIEHKPDTVIFFGDIFNSPESISSIVMTIAAKIFSDLAEYTSVLFITGNHDIVDNKTSSIKIGEDLLEIKTNLLSSFANYNNIGVFDSPKVISIAPGVEIGFVPYSHNIIQNLEELNKKFSKGTKRILMGHFEMLKSYHLIKDNIDISKNLPSKEDLINKYNYDMVLLGHIHDIEEYLIDNKLVKYIGSCRNVDFRNTGKHKGIYLLDFDDLSLQFIDNSATSIYKICKSFDEIKEYCLENDPEILSRTKIMYIYNDKKDLMKISKVKTHFKSIKFQKESIINNLSDSSISIESIHEFEDLIKNNLVTKENLIDYALQFKEPVNKIVALKIFDYI